MKRLFNVFSLLVVVAFLLGCDVAGLYETSVDVGSAKALREGVVIHERTFDRLVYLKATSSKSKLTELYRAEEGEQLIWFRVGPDLSDPTDVFAMSVPTEQRDVERDETLLRIRPDGQPIERYEIESRFNKLLFGPYQRFAILHHEVGDESGSLLYNPNEVAIIDLETTTTRRLTLDLAGQQVLGVSFLPKLAVTGIVRQFAVFYAVNNVLLVDLLDADGATAVIPLTDSDDPRTVIPAQFLAREEDEVRETMIFVRATGSEDVYAISLTSFSADAGKFTASVNQLEAGGAPLDMALVQDGSDPMLAVLSSATWAAGGMIVNMVNVDTAGVFPVEVGDSVTRAVLRDETGAQEVVLFGDNTQGVYFLQTDGIVEEKERNLERVVIPDNVERAVLLDSNRLLIIPDSYRDLILLDLDSRDATPLTSPVAVDWNEAQIVGDRFFCVPATKDRIDMVDLQSGHPDSLLLDDAVQSLHLLKGSQMGVVLHDTPSGRVTIFPLDKTKSNRGEARVIDGIWLDGFLDEKEVSQ